MYNMPQSRKSREDERLAMEIKGVKDKMKGMSHGEKVKRCMAANPGMSLAAASKKVAAMNKKK